MVLARPLRPAPGMMRRLCALIALLLLLLAPRAHAGTVKELVRVQGQGEFILRGVGLVIGLPGTGDDTKDLAVARPLAALLKASGDPIGSATDLGKKNRAVALVMVTCVVPMQGAKIDDRMDVTVATMGSAKSLAGGQLFLAPLKGPYPESPVYAIAEGLVETQGTDSPTVARVRGAARVIRDMMAPPIQNQFDLIIEQPYSGWAPAAQIAAAINNKAMPGGAPVARAVDERTVRITVPEAERADRAGFLADVLSADITLSQLELPAQVIINQRTGAIIVTGDVEISPVAITHKDLSISTVVPAPVPSAGNPVVRKDHWVDLKTGARPNEAAKLADLLAAFKQLDIPVQEQIGILQMLHKTGKLQARLIMD